jgi:hypothetical protein
VPASLLALGAALLAGVAGGEPRIDGWSWRGALPAGALVRVENLAGDLRVRGVDGGEVEVAAVLQRLAPEAGAARIEVSEAGGELRIRVVAPSVGGARRDRVDLAVLLPRRAAIAARVGNGRLEARGVEGRLELESEHGPLEARPAATGRLRTGGGAVEVELAAGREIDLELVTAGPARIAIPRAASLRIEARSRDRILLDVNLEVARDPASSDATLSGRLGAGTGRLRVVAAGELALLAAGAAQKSP